MADTARPVENNGLVFATTSDGHLLESEVRTHVEALQHEVAELRTRLEHVTSLERLAQATVMKADDLAAEIEAEARRRVDQMTEACETQLVERRRQFEVETSAQQAAAQARMAQLQAALEGTLQTLGRALQAAGAPALEMPAASAPTWAPAPASSPAVETNGQEEAPGESAAAIPAGNEPNTYFGGGPPAVDAAHRATEAEPDAAEERGQPEAHEPEWGSPEASATEPGGGPRSRQRQARPGTRVGLMMLARLLPSRSRPTRLNQRPRATWTNRNWSRPPSAATAAPSS